MSELDVWAEQAGYMPGHKPPIVGLWLDKHPDKAQQIVEARRRGWSWKRICQFLTDTADFPYTANPLQTACQRRGIL